MHLMRPIVRLFTQPFTHWVLPDVVMFFGCLVFTPEPMVKKAILPPDAERSSRIAFP